MLSLSFLVSVLSFSNQKHCVMNPMSILYISPMTDKKTTHHMFDQQSVKVDPRNHTVKPGARVQPFRKTFDLAGAGHLSISQGFTQKSGSCSLLYAILISLDGSLPGF